jgi:hypothetical protein
VDKLIGLPTALLIFAALRVVSATGIQLRE